LTFLGKNGKEIFGKNQFPFFPEITISTKKSQRNRWARALVNYLGKKNKPFGLFQKVLDFF